MQNGLTSCKFFSSLTDRHDAHVRTRVGGSGAAPAGSSSASMVPGRSGRFRLGIRRFRLGLRRFRLGLRRFRLGLRRFRLGLRRFRLVVPPLRRAIGESGAQSEVPARAGGRRRSRRNRSPCRRQQIGGDGASRRRGHGVQRRSRSVRPAPAAHVSEPPSTDEGTPRPSRAFAMANQGTPSRCRPNIDSEEERAARSLAGASAGSARRPLRSERGGSRYPRPPHD